MGEFDAITPHRSPTPVAKNERDPSSLRPPKRQPPQRLRPAVNHHGSLMTDLALSPPRDRRVYPRGESGNFGQLDFQDVSACADESYNTICMRAAAARETACSIG
jgi:hypothetical protein